MSLISCFRSIAIEEWQILMRKRANDAERSATDLSAMAIPVPGGCANGSTDFEMGIALLSEEKLIFSVFSVILRRFPLSLVRVNIDLIML